jgi:signal transduction histidine kinase
LLGKTGSMAEHVPEGARLDQILDRLPQGLVLVDCNLEIAFLNAAAKRLLFDGSAAKPGDPLPEPWPPLSLHDLARELLLGRPVEGRFISAGSRLLWIEGLPAVDGDPAVLLIEDVTERQRATRSEREFVENAAHELRTPLAAIVSVMDVLESGAKDIPEVRDRFLRHIKLQSERLSRLASALLVLARIQAGAQPPRLSPVPIRALLTEIADGLDTLDGVDVEVRSPADVAALADPDLLHRILANVADNSAKHTHTGEIVLEARTRGRLAEIEIRDTGPGMDGAQRAHAFDRFYRASGDETAGFGLGLAIAAEAARLIGGAIELDSEPNVGTTVRLTLPSARILG